MPGNGELKKQLIQLQKQVEAIQNQIQSILTIVRNKEQKKEWFTTAEAARISGLGRKTISNYASSGAWKSKKLPNGRYLIAAENLTEYLDD